MIRPIKKNCPAGVAAPTGRVKNPASSRKEDASPTYHSR
nr:MAG TPA: hypothetical protein [Caudoviricetes sp.]